MKLVKRTLDSDKNQKNNLNEKIFIINQRLVKDCSDQMQNFNSLKSMWESKAKQQQSCEVKMKPLPQKLKSPTSSELSDRDAQTPSITVTPPEPPTEIPRQNVAMLRSNLQGKIKFGGDSMMQSALGRVHHVQNSHIIENGTNNQSEVKKPSVQMHRQTEVFHKNAEIVEQKLPSFLETKAELEKMFEKKKSTPLSHQESGAVNFQKSYSSGKVMNPEQRTEFLINRIFCNEAIHFSNNTLPHVEKNQQPSVSEKSQKSEQTFLAVQQQAKDLSLRGKKKQKKKQINFDDF